jgi:hypothetical protein
MLSEAQIEPGAFADHEIWRVGATVSSIGVANAIVFLEPKRLRREGEAIGKAATDEQKRCIGPALHGAVMPRVTITNPSHRIVIERSRWLNNEYLVREGPAGSQTNVPPTNQSRWRVDRRIGMIAQAHFRSRMRLKDMR